MVTYKLHFIRHGMTEGNRVGRYVGRMDLPICREGREELEKMKNDPNVKYIKPKNPALEYHDKLQFKDAVVYVNGERCLRKGKKLSDGDEVWLLSPAAGG